MRILTWVVAAIAVVWLIRTLRRAAAYWLGVSGADTAEERARTSPFRRAPAMAPRELMKDPQCGTYIAPELSIRARFRGQELHFCSRECEQRFIETQSEKSS